MGRSNRLLVGSYLVSVTARELVPSQDPNYPPTAKTIIPIKYATSSGSGIKVDVKTGGNRIDLELDSL